MSKENRAAEARKIARIPGIYERFVAGALSPTQARHFAVDLLYAEESSGGQKGRKAQAARNRRAEAEGRYPEIQIPVTRLSEGDPRAHPGTTIPWGEAQAADRLTDALVRAGFINIGWGAGPRKGYPSDVGTLGVEIPAGALPKLERIIAAHPIKGAARVPSAREHGTAIAEVRGSLRHRPEPAAIAFWARHEVPLLFGVGAGGVVMGNRLDRATGWRPLGSKFAPSAAMALIGGLIAVAVSRMRRTPNTRMVSRGVGALSGGLALQALGAQVAGSPR